MKPKKEIPRLFILNDNTVLRIAPTLAAEIGLNESIMLLQIDFLKSISTTENKKGRPWTFQSIRQLQDDYFPFWSKDTINRTIASLQSKKLIRCDNFNKAAYDRTRWMSINYGKVGRLKSVHIGGVSQNATRSMQNATRSMQNATTIPESSTETSTESNADALPMTPRLKESKTKNKKAAKKVLSIPEIEPLIKIIVSNGMKESAISSNLKMLMLNAVELHGIEFCDLALRGRYVQAARQQRPAALGRFFDPENGEWMTDCSKLATVPTVQAGGVVEPHMIELMAEFEKAQCL